MLKRNRLSCLMLLPVFMTPSTITPFHNQAWQLIENKVDNKEMVHDRFGMIKHPIEIQFEKDKLKQQKEKKLEEQKKNEPQWQEFILTYYSGLQIENSSKGAITCTGKRLESDMVANNIYSLGTQIYLEGYGNKVVADRGSNKYFGYSNRLDVYVEREPNESDNHYFSRVQKLGVKKVRGYVIK